jgi:hypothetical protein
MQKTKMESPLDLTNKVDGIERETPEGSTSGTFSSKKIKPRALIFKATDKDLTKIKEVIETQFTKVEIIYVTTGPAASILHVTKSMPLDKQNSSVQPLYTIE